MQKNTVYLRPETAQGIFVNFKNVQRTSRKKIPFGICQIGKSFRNEITPGNFTFRTREFEQMELEFFCEPGTDLEWFDYWRSFCRDWLLSLGMKEDELRLRDHDPAELAFYSKATTDLEFLFPFGWGELWGIADRTDYDLTQHQNTSGQDMTYFDDEKREKYIPYVIEPSLGADRVVLAFLCAAYDEENIGTEEKPDMRTVLHFHPALAPVKIGVLPLSKKLNEGAEKSSHSYLKNITVNLTIEETSENVTEDRMRSVHHSVSLMISTPKRMEQLPYVTVTPWSRLFYGEGYIMTCLRKTGCMPARFATAFVSGLISNGDSGVFSVFSSIHFDSAEGAL